MQVGSIMKYIIDYCQKIIKALLSLKAKDRVIIIATHDQLIAKQCDEIINVEDYRV